MEIRYHGNLGCQTGYAYSINHGLIYPIERGTVRTDNLFYKLFQQAPNFAFQLLGLPLPPIPYQFQSVELKEFGFRLDGLLLPIEPDANLPFVLIEAQMQPDARFYSHFGLECDTNLCNNYE